MGAPLLIFDQAFEHLLSLAGEDQYARVRRRSLLVLLFFATSPESPFTAAHVEPLFKRVLIPQAASHDPDVREACSNIAQRLAIILGILAVGANEGMVIDENIALSDGGGAGLSHLWQELSEALTLAASTAGNGPSVE